ncbi:MAG: sugar phosphate nucleotidyltransferase [Pseudomonadota bacterium]
MNIIEHAGETMHRPLKHAMVMAAGLGTRLRPLTRDTPKPLLPIMNDGTCCLGRALDRLHQQKFDRIVVNAYYLPDLIESFLQKNYPHVHISRETEPLETGGGFLNALPFFDDRAPVLIVNGDTYAGADFDACSDSDFEAYSDSDSDSDAYSDSDSHDHYESRLLSDFSPSSEDILLGIGGKAKGIGFTGAGDYDLSGRHLSYRPNGISAPYVFVGYRVVMPSFMRRCAEMLRPSKGTCFSFKDCFDIAEANGRLAGHRFDGVWCDLSTIETLNALRKKLDS